jgi:hypothetical protein
MMVVCLPASQRSSTASISLFPVFPIFQLSPVEAKQTCLPQTGIPLVEDPVFGAGPR